MRAFDGTRQPLTLVSGRHHIEIDAPGFQPWAYDVDIVAGQVIPYRGDLQPPQYPGKSAALKWAALPTPNKRECELYRSKST